MIAQSCFELHFSDWDQIQHITDTLKVKIFKNKIYELFV